MSFTNKPYASQIYRDDNRHMRYSHWYSEVKNLFTESFREGGTTPPLYWINFILKKSYGLRGYSPFMVGGKKKFVASGETLQVIYGLGGVPPAPFYGRKSKKTFRCARRFKIESILYLQSKHIKLMKIAIYLLLKL